MVQFANVRQMKNHISEMIRRSRRGDIVVTSRGRPQAVLHAITEEDLEDYLLANSPKFLKSLQSSYQEYQQKGGTSLEGLIAETERELARLRR